MNGFECFSSKITDTTETVIQIQKIMKTQHIILTVIFLIAFSTTVDLFAQQRGIQQNPGLQIGLLYADNMNLSEEQKINIATLMAEHRAEMREARNNMSRGARVENREKRVEAQTDLQSQIKELLTPEQMRTFESNMQMARENRLEAHTYMMRAQADAISEEVGLTASKKENVQKVVMNHLEKTKDFRQNRQAVRPDTESRIERLEARRDFENELKSILSDDEYKAWLGEWAKMHPMLDGRRGERGMKGNSGQRGDRGDYRLNKPGRN